MSDNCLLMEAVDYVDDEYLKKYFNMKERIASPKSKKKLRVMKWSVSVAACLCLVFLTIVTPYIPTKYDLNYSYVGENGQEIFIPDNSIWIYYIANNRIKRERVKLPSTPNNVFLAWKHLNNIGSEVSLIKCEVISDGVESVLTFDGRNVYEHSSNSKFELKIIVSDNLNKYMNELNKELMIESLKKTISGCSTLRFEKIELILQTVEKE